MSNQINKEDYVYVGQYKCPLLYYQLVHQWVNHKKADDYKVASLEKGKSLFLDGHMFINKEDWNSITSQLSKAIKNKEETFFQKFFSLSNSEINKLLSATDKLVSQKRINPEIFEEFFSAMKDMEFPWMMTIPIGKALESELSTIFKLHAIPNKHIQSFLLPSKPTKLMKQREELHNINNKLRQKNLLDDVKNLSASEALKLIKSKDKMMYNDIKEHVKEYKWMGMMHFWGSPFTKEKLIDHLRDAKDLSIQQLEKACLPSHLEWLKKHTRDMTFWRNCFAEACSIASYKSLAMFEKASKSLGLRWEQARWLSPEEFIACIEGKLKPSLDVIDKRKKGFGLVLEGGKSTILTGNKMYKLIDNLLESHEGAHYLEGIAASKGKVKGRVKIVLTPQDITKVRKGDIVVSPETTPDFLPVFHKAIGIVTDMGGITGHAAIVSREFSIPCVVGTNQATRIFKDGDIIEIDGDKGIVKKTNPK